MNHSSVLHFAAAFATLNVCMSGTTQSASKFLQSVVMWFSRKYSSFSLSSLNDEYYIFLLI